jgi:hypothetical protein
MPLAVAQSTVPSRETPQVLNVRLGSDREPRCLEASDAKLELVQGHDFIRLPL